MNELKTFDINAMSTPKTPQDILALLREFRAEAKNVLARLAELGRSCEANLSAPTEA